MRNGTHKDKKIEGGWVGKFFNTEPHAQGRGADSAGERKHGYYIYISSHRGFPFKIQKILVLVGNAITVSVACCQAHDMKIPAIHFILL
jgi:hypothetical protein